MDDTAPAADELARLGRNRGSPPSPVPSRSRLLLRRHDRGDEGCRDEAPSSGLYFGSEERQSRLSKEGPEGLVRLVGRRRLPQCAGSIGASNVACRWLTPDLTTAIQAVAKSGVEAGQTGAVTRITDLLFGRLPRRLPQAHGCTQGQRLTRRFGRVRPRDSCLAAQRSISGRSQSLTRPRPDQRQARHVGVPALILGDGVAVSEAEDFRDAFCVDEIFGVDVRGHAD